MLGFLFLISLIMFGFHLEHEPILVGIFLACSCWIIYLSFFAVILNHTQIANETYTNHEYVSIPTSEDNEEEFANDNHNHNHDRNTNDTQVGLSIDENYFSGPTQTIATRE